MMEWLATPDPIPRWLHICYLFILFTAVCQSLFGIPA